MLDKGSLDAGMIAATDHLGDTDAAALSDLACDLLGQHGSPIVAGRTGSENSVGRFWQHFLDEALHYECFELLGARWPSSSFVGRPQIANSSAPLSSRVRRYRADGLTGGQGMTPLMQARQSRDMRPE